MRVTDETAPLLTLAVELSDAQIERIAARTAALVAHRAPAEVEPLSLFVTIPEAAELLRCRRQRIDDLLSQGRLTRVKDGSRTLIERLELEAHLGRQASRKIGSGRSSGIR